MSNEISIWDIPSLSLSPDEVRRLDQQYISEKRRHVYGAPCIDPEKMRQSWKDYDVRALAPMLGWIQSAASRRVEDHMYCHREVHDELKKYDPPCCHEKTFAKEKLLPELFKREVESLPLDIIAILYTLGVPCGPCKLLTVCIDEDPKTGLGKDNLFIRFQYEDTGQIRCIKVVNFKNPATARLERPKQ